MQTIEGFVGAAQSAVREDRVAELVASCQVGEQLGDLLAEGGRGRHCRDGGWEGVIGVCRHEVCECYLERCFVEDRVWGSASKLFEKGTEGNEKKRELERL